MKVFIDTSAWVTLADADDANHATAHRLWNQLLAVDSQRVITSYVLLETISVLQRRFGMQTIPPFLGYLQYVQIEWVDETLHQQGLRLFLQENRRSLSLVDCTSFEFMRNEGIQIAFCFDAHFSEFGFDILSEAHFSNSP